MMQDDAAVAVRRAQGALKQASEALDRAAETLAVPVEADRGAAERHERVYAMEIVFDALVQAMTPRGFDRKQFQAIVRHESERAPTEGPGQARHAALLHHARRVLGVRPGG